MPADILDPLYPAKPVSDHGRPLGDTIDHDESDNGDTVDQAGLDIEGDDEDQPDGDNPNDVGKDESLG